MSLIKKIWGTRKRLLVTNQAEVDLLILDKNTACSIHRHATKINRFVLLQGSVDIKSELGTKSLKAGEAFDVEPPITHQFIVNQDSIMIELAFVKEGKIEADDILRKVQGGKMVWGKFVTLDTLRDNGDLEL